MLWWTLTKSKASSPKREYNLAFKTAALSEWSALDGSVKELFRSALKKRLVNPHLPGSLLKGDLKFCYKIKLAKAGYRLVYTVQDDQLLVLVLSVGKREGSQAYRQAASRKIQADKPNKETIAAMKEARKGKLKSFKSVDDLITDLNEGD